MTKLPELPVEKLRFFCDEQALDFESTASVPSLEVMIGQERAVKAVEFGLYAQNHGYNIFLSGLVGTGKFTYAKAAVRKAARNKPIPGDWCYVNNFENPSQPISLGLPPGMGATFRQDMKEFVDDLRTDVSKAFSSDNYEQAKAELIKEFQEKRAQFIDEFNESAEAIGISPQWSTTGFVGLPIVDGKPLPPEEFQKLDKEQRDEIEKKLRTVHEKAMEIVRRMQQSEREIREHVKNLDVKVGLFAVGHLIDELKEKYLEHTQVVDYLEAVKQDVVKNIGDFKPAPVDEEHNPLLLFRKNAKESVEDKYSVNLLVDNHACEGAPVVIEINPTYYNLFGRGEYEHRMGVVSTNFTMIKSGAIHKANGGYLVVNARDVLMNIGVWEALKRLLKTKKLYIENLGEQYGMIAMASVKPQPIPIDIKVIMLGSPQLYHLMFNHDEDFRKLFKVFADFDTQMDNDLPNIKKLAGFISSTVKKENLKEFNRAAVAKVVEHASRLADSQKKLTTRFNEIVELLCEADAWAAVDGSEVVEQQHIKKAIEEKRYRSNKYEERLQEMFADGKFLIDTEGEAVGQINGLAVLGVGDYAFGKPSRITANTYLGKSGVVNIERETKMSGTSHSKGVMILSGYMGQKYAQKQPLTLTASLTFEQLYDGVDGDSASSTELYALLSSLSGVPLRQYIAVTGSVNQKGEIQPIGGATQKIEGFFAVCQIKGLTGKQGVMIPYQNIDNLALSDEVIEAVREGKFHIYPIKTIDEGIEILTGIPAGEVQPDGTYPENTVHGMVSRKLKDYTDTLIKLGKSAEGEKNS